MNTEVLNQKGEKKKKKESKINVDFETSIIFLRVLLAGDYVRFMIALKLFFPELNITSKDIIRIRKLSMTIIPDLQDYRDEIINKYIEQLSFNRNAIKEFLTEYSGKLDIG